MKARYRYRFYPTSQQQHFTLPNESLEKQFIYETSQAGIIGVAGHRTRGGCRVSLYNGVTLEAVEKLIEFMDKFAKQKDRS